MANRGPKLEPGPFHVDQIRPGDRYELSDGHPVYCAPTGGEGARRNGTGFEVLDSDPEVEEAGVDAGYAPTKNTLRAPDISVGNVPDKPGWIAGAPPLAVEYAGTGQDERELQEKIVDLLKLGTRWIWVVRLVGPRRVEVYEPGLAVRTVGPGAELVAPGVLRNPVPVEALYDRRAAHEVTLRNLLQRKGYDGLDAVLEEGRQEGRLEAAAGAVLAVLDARRISLSTTERARIAQCRDQATLDRWIGSAATVTSARDLFAS